MSVTRYASCCSPGPFFPMNFAMVEFSSRGARSCRAVLPAAAPGNDSIASRTPCPSFTSSWVETIPRCSLYHAIAASRSGTAMPTWSIAVTRSARMGRPVEDGVVEVIESTLASVPSNRSPGLL